MKSKNILIFLLLALLTVSCNSGTDSRSTSLASFSASGSIVSNLAQVNSVCIKDSVSIIGLAGTVNLGGADQISGDVVALNNASVQIGGSVSISGTLYLDSGAQSHLGGADTIIGGVVQADISQDQSLITEFITQLSSLEPTQESDAITTSTTLQSSGALNVININDGLTLNGGQRLTLNGGATDIFIINVIGDFSTGGNGGIFLTGGLLPANVIINNVGSGANVSIGGNDEISGTIIAYNRGINIGGSDTIRGALVAGNGISIGGSNSVWSPQGFCGVTKPPTPSASPIPTQSLCTDLVCPASPLPGGGVTGI